MSRHKFLGALVLFLYAASPVVLCADLYLPPEGSSLPSIVVEEFVAPRKWDSATAGVPAAVTYSFVTSLTATYDETAIGGGSGTLTPITSFMPAGATNEIRDAFDAWSAVANITFTEVTDSGNDYNTILGDSDADIRVAGHAFDGASGTLAHAVTSSFVTTPLQTIALAWIDFDIAENWTVDSINGDNSSTIDIFQVAAHEIGHAIGLGHETTNVALMNPFYTEAFEGLLADDINGAQFLYGAVAVPEPSAFLFGGLVCCVSGVNYARKRRS